MCHVYFISFQTFMYTASPFVRSVFSILASAGMVVIAFAPVIIAPQIARAANVYTIVQTGSAVIVGTTVTITGTASANPFVGLLNDQHISIDWDDDGNATPDNWEQENSDASGNDAGLTSDITFDIDAFTNQGNDKTFTENNWSATHTFAESGPYSLFVQVHHASQKGKGEGSDFSTIQIDIVIPPLTQCNDGIDNADPEDTLVDLQDPGCTDASDNDETNTPPPPTTASLLVKKQVINNNGGSAVAANWNLAVNSSNGGTGTGNAAGSETGTSYTLQADKAYSVTESGGPSGYTESKSTDCNISNVTAGSSYTCTVTNDDVAPLLTLVKEVVGDALASLWTLSAAGPTPFSGTGGATSDSTFSAGSYNLFEAGGPNHYLPNGWLCIGGVQNGSSITLGVGQNAACTITNTFVPPTPGTVTIVKNTVGGDESFDFTGDFGEFTLSTEGGTTNTTFSDLSANTYAVTETVPDGWEQTSATCDNGDDPSAITLNANTEGENNFVDGVTCTFENTKTTGTLVVIKNLINDDGGTGVNSNFSFSVDSAEPIVFEEDGQNEITVPVGFHSVAESAASGYNTTYDNCSEVEVIPGGTATCTITNDDVEVTPPPTTQCSDNEDNDGDGKVDFDGGSQEGTPDPGCETPTDNDETDPVVGGGTQCSDRIDNDHDGQADFPADSGCSSASDDDEVDHTSGGGSSVRRSSGGSSGGVVLGASTEECSEYLFEYIKLGGTNNPSEVTKLQQFLNDFEAFNLAVNGTYDDASYNAVHSFQKKYADRVLTPWGATRSTGYVYYTTKKTINEIYCQFTKEFPLSTQQEAEIARVKALGEAWQSSTGASAPVGGQVELPPSTGSGQAAPQSDETPEIGSAEDNAAQSAAAANAPASTGNWWTNFWNWLLGK